MDEIKTCKDLMEEVESLHQTLINLLTINNNGCVGFEIEQILASDETKTMKNGVKRLEVGQSSRERILSFHRKYYREQRLSTKFVERMPGLIVANGHFDEIRAIVININKLKDDIMLIVNTGRDKHQRHEFIHTTFPRIMTDQFRRHIHIFDHPISNAWFNWTSRPVNETLSVDNAITFLENEIDNIKGMLEPIEWRAMINGAINELRTGVFESAQRVKRLKLLPIMSYKYRNALGEDCRFTKNANTPFILLNQDNNQMPRYSALDTYIKPDEPSSKTISRAKNRKVLNPYLRLEGVYSK